MRKMLMIAATIGLSTCVNAQSFAVHATSETKDLLENNTLMISNGTCATSYCATISSNYARLGVYSTRFEVDSTDPYAPPSLKTRRAERFQPRDSSKYFSKYAFSFLPDSGFFDPKNCLIAQWYCDYYQDSSWDAVLAVWIWNNHYMLQQRFDSSGNHPIKFNTRRWDLGPLVNWQWDDFTFDINWAIDTSGYIKVYRNGVPYTLNQVDQNTGKVLKTVPYIKGANFNNEYGKKQKPCYYRHGIYAFGGFSKTDRKIGYFDEVKSGGIPGDGTTINDYIIPPVTPAQIQNQKNSYIISRNKFKN